MPTPEQRDYFQRRSAEIRAMAQKALDPEIRTTLQGMAESYDKLVEEADRIAHLRIQLPDVLPPESLSPRNDRP